MQHIGPISLLFFWLSMLFILKKWNFDIKLTFSDHVKSSTTRIVYVPSVFITITAFTASTIFWLLPRLSAHWTAYMFICIAYLMKITTAVVPRTKNRLVLHDVSATIVGTALLGIIISLGVSSSIGDRFLYFLWSSIIIMFGIGFHLMDRTRSTYLALQGVYFLIFTINIVLLTYFVAA